MLKNILDLILDEHRLVLFFITLAWLSPLIGISIGLIARNHSSKPSRFFGQCVFWGFIGPLISLMWVIYNAIMNHYGLDSVKALLINLVIFVVIGILLGWSYRRIFKHPIT